MRFHHWLPTRFHDLEASNESRNEICCVGNFGTCLYVRMLYLLSCFGAYADNGQN